MQSADKRKFLEILNGMAALKPGKPLTPNAIELFWNSMQHWSLAEFQAASNELMRSVEFMPNPFHFEALRKKASELAPMEAWTEATNRSANRRLFAMPEDRITRAVVCVGGYERLAMADIERELPHIQRRFLDAYEQMVESDGAQAALPNLSDRKDLLKLFPQASRDGGFKRLT